MNKRLGIIIILLSVIGIDTDFIAYTEIVRKYELDPQIPKLGSAIQIQNMSNDAWNLLIYVQNVGNGIVTLDHLYVNGNSQAFTNSSSLTLQMGQNVALSTALPAGSSTNPVDVKVVCTDGTNIEAKQTIQ